MNLGWCLDSASTELHFPAHTKTQICQLLLSLSHWVNAEICFIAGQFIFFHYWPQYCFQKLLLKHQWWMIAQNNIATSLPWHRQWLCVLQNPNCSIQEEAALWELLRETLGGKPVKASRKANGPPKRSYKPEDWREAYSLFSTMLSKFNLKEKIYRVHNKGTTDMLIICCNWLVFFHRDFT